MADSIESPIILFFEDTLSPIKKKHATWIYLWKEKTIITLANHNNPIAYNDILHFAGDVEHMNIYKASQYLLDKGYKQVDDPEALAAIYRHVVDYMRRTAFD